MKLRGLTPALAQKPGVRPLVTGASNAWPAAKWEAHAMPPGLAGACADVLHARFLRLLPKLAAHAHIVFRGVRCPVKQADKVQECVALVALATNNVRN